MNRLKELRKEKKQTQKEFAKETGTPLRTLQSWENGESQIKPEKAQQLADYFGVSVGYLLGYNVDNVSDYWIEFDNKIVEQIHQESFVMFLDFILHSDIKLSDKQILAIFEQLKATSDINTEYRFLEKDTSKTKSLFSLCHNYVPTFGYREREEIYSNEKVKMQYTEARKIMNGENFTK